MSIHAIRELRERTHLGITECKGALDEAQGDVEKAVEILQKRGSLKKVDPLLETREGLVEAYVANNFGIIVEVNCQTDFAARSDIFRSFVHNFLVENYDSRYLSDHWMEKSPLVSKQLGEKLNFKRADDLYLGTDDNFKPKGICRAYNHHSGKIAVLLAIEVASEHQTNQDLIAFADELAMQVAANNPVSIDRTSMFEELRSKQLNMFEAQVKEQMPNKPQQMLEKIINGKMDKWYQENCLMEQESIVHPKKRLDTLAVELRKKIGVDFTVKSFIRYELGA